MEIQVKYTITTAYVFDEDEVAREHPEENDVVELAEQWIQEDFDRITNRVNNVLPFDYKVDIQFMEKEDNKE